MYILHTEILYRNQLQAKELSCRKCRFRPKQSIETSVKNTLSLTGGDALPMSSCLSPSISFIPLQKRRGSRNKCLVQSPSSCFMGVKCPRCYRITLSLAVHRQQLCVFTAVLFLASLQEEEQPYRRTSLTEGCSFRPKQCSTYHLYQDEWETFPIHILDKRKKKNTLS